MVSFRKYFVFSLLFLLFFACSKKEAAQEETAPPPSSAPSAVATQKGPPPTIGAGPTEGEAPAPPLAAIEPPPPETPPAGDEGVQAITAPTIVPPPTKLEEAKPVEFSPELVREATSVNIILDGSGSMSAPFGTTTVLKFDLVESALLDILSVAAPADTVRNIGLRVFGMSSPVGEKNCKDSERLYPLGQLNFDELKKSLQKAEPQGMSPLSYALTQATSDFPAEGDADRVIVLITDGADACELDPCSIAEQIHTQHRAVIHVVGFDLTNEDQQKVECIATKSDGRFFTARTENELRASLEEAISATVPYNLKLIASAGDVPIQTEITVFTGGTEDVVRREKSFGTKLMKLPQGSYDVLVEFIDSPEPKKPSKLLKGVELLTETKLEQTIRFDLGQVTVAAIDDEGKFVATRYRVSDAASGQMIAEVETPAERRSLFLTPGTYDITAEPTAAGPEKFLLTEKAVAVTMGASADRTFRFQRGMVTLTGKTTQGTFIPFIYQVYKEGTIDNALSSGALPAGGGTVSLAPGNYDILVIGQDPTMAADPRTKITGVVIEPTVTKPLEALFEMGALKIRAVDNAKKSLPAKFTIREQETNDVLAIASFDGEKTVELPIPPGTYTIIAELARGEVDPKPTVPVTNIVVAPDKPTETTVVFTLGTLRLRGRDAKEHSLPTRFTLFAAGRDQSLVEAPQRNDWLSVDIAPGLYDALAENMATEPSPFKERPRVWIRGINVEDAKTISHEAIFTAGKIKIIGRGPNNKIINCKFKIFQYGSDRELINGETGDDWMIFEIDPGKYYMEAAYLDPEGPQLLKKWINISVSENEIVEQVLRF